MVTLNIMSEKKVDAINKYSYEAIKNASLKSNKIETKEDQIREDYLFFNTTNKNSKFIFTK